MKEIQYWIWLSRMQEISNKTKLKLLAKYGTLEKLWEDPKITLQEKTKKQVKIQEVIQKREYRENLDQYEAYMKQYGIQLVSILSPEYPEQLKTICDAPILLYVIGDSQILKEDSIAIIGCRQCSSYGKKSTKQIAYELAQNKKVIVSGMAKGIDSYAHYGCLEAKGKTIAVLGSGLDRIYPKENIPLYHAILQGNGCIVSEYPIGVGAAKYHFPARNRIISGLSKGIVVVEAKEKSGSLITVDFGLEQGRDIFAIPGNIDTNTSKGTNLLLKQGAKLVTTIQDILEEYE